MAIPLVNDRNGFTILATHTGQRPVLVIVSEWTLTLMTSHKKEPTSTFWFTENYGMWTWSRPVGLNGIKKRNLMSLWRGLMSLCMVWLNCLFAIWFFCLFGCFIGVRVSENVCCCICFCFWGLCSPCIRCIFFKYSIFVLTPSSLPFLLPSVLQFGRGQCLPKLSFMLQGGRDQLPQTVETLYTSFQP